MTQVFERNAKAGFARRLSIKKAQCDQRYFQDMDLYESKLSIWEKFSKNYIGDLVYLSNILIPFVLHHHFCKITNVVSSFFIAT